MDVQEIIMIRSATGLSLSESRDAYLKYGSAKEALKELNDHKKVEKVWSEYDKLRAQVERLEAQRKQLREALLDLMAASGALNGNPASDNPHEAKARAALKATE